MKKCMDLMTKSMICCLPKDPVTKVAQLMKNNDIGSVPVIDAAQTMRPIGMVTDRDLALGVLAAGRDPYTTTAQDVMSGAVVTCRGDEDVINALDAMAGYQLRRIPVVDHNNRLIGIITQADVATRLDQPKRTAEVVKEVSLSNALVMEH